MRKIKVVDPDDISETLVAGPYNLTIDGALATLIFTHLRPGAAKLMASTSKIEAEAVVRARLVMPVEGLRALRDSLDQILRGLEAERSTPSSVGGH